MVTGEVNLTCDAWQASNTDAYFAVTGHWVEESKPGSWELQSAVLGLTQLNNAHHGRRLGQALFKICDRVGIAHKVFFSMLYLKELTCFHRLDTLPVTMLPTMIPCLESLPTASSMGQVNCGYPRSIVSGM